MWKEEGMKREGVEKWREGVGSAIRKISQESENE